MKTDNYNGWTNYETWNVALWIDNDEGSYNYWEDEAREIARKADDKDEAIRLLSDSLKEHFESASHDLLEASHASASVWADLLGAALSEVNWYEIAAGKLEDKFKEESETA